jgi:DNA polymerase III epsilon subunit family exonuclease
VPNRTGDPYDLWWKHNLVVFDVETTGLDETEDRVIEVGFARFEQGKLVDQWGTLIYPEREIPEEASEIHGITTAQVATAPRFHATIANALRMTRNAWPVAYNAGFDRKFWAMELGRMALGDLVTPMFDPAVEWFDPIVWFRQMDGVWAGNKLTQVSERYGIDLENAHRATDDAMAAGRLIFEVLQERLPKVTMTELLRRQRHYDAKHDAERRAWFKKKGIPYR